MSIILLLLFVAFGAVCGVYLSIVGFVVTTIVIFGGLGLISAVAGGVMTPGFLLVAFVAEQVGFFVAIVVLALREAYRRRHDVDKPLDVPVPAEHERTR